MKFTVFLVVLCAVSLKDVLVSASCGCGSHNPPTPQCCLQGDACRTYCPKTTDLVNEVFEIEDGLSPEYCWFYLGGKIYFLFRCSLDVSAPGEPSSAKLVLYDLVVFLFKIGGKIYYISTLGEGNPYGGCPRVFELQNTTRSSFPSVLIPDVISLEIIRQLEAPFDSQCTVLTRYPPPNDALYAFSLNNLYGAKVCQPKDQNNASFSVFRDYVNRNGDNEHIRITPGFISGPAYCEYGSYIDSECGVPNYCPFLNSLPDFEQVIRNGQCDPRCINTVNKNAPTVLSRCYAAGSTLSDQPPPLTTTYRAAFTGPISNNKIYFFVFAGYLYSAAFNDFMIKPLQLS